MLAALVLPLLLVRCGGDGFSPPACGENAALSVGTGASPEFTWSPACRAAGLQVVVLDRFESVGWSIATVNLSNRLQSPLRYGVVPAGAVQQGELTPLEAGHTYRALLLVAEPAQNGEAQLSGAGAVDFTR